MADEKQEGCVAVAAGPIASQPEPTSGSQASAGAHEKEVRMQVMVGKGAPDFEASAFHEGGFKNVKLSDFRGKWVFLCFYPGDFTFV